MIEISLIDSNGEWEDCFWKYLFVNGLTTKLVKVDVSGLRLFDRRIEGFAFDRNPH